MTVKALKKKNKMSGPFKLKSGNSPLFKNLGSSPVRNDKFADKKTESKKADESNARDDTYASSLKPGDGRPEAPGEPKSNVAIGTEKVSKNSPGSGWTKTKGTNIWTYNG